jgi:hypothetical protein
MKRVLAASLALAIAGASPAMALAVRPAVPLHAAWTAEFPVMPAVETVVQEPAPATPDGKVVVNIGQWLDVLQEFLLSIFTLVLTAIIAMLPMPARALIMTWRVNQMATQAARVGLARAKDKLRDKLGPDGTITIPVKSAAAELAAEYAIDYANQAVTDFAGGKNGWKEKVLARIEELIASVATQYKEAGSGDKPAVVAVSVDKSRK